MPTSFTDREDHARNPLSEEQRDEAERAALDGAPASADTIQALLFELDRLRMMICEWHSFAERESRKRLGDDSYYGPSHAADSLGWGYLYRKDD